MTNSPSGNAIEAYARDGSVVVNVNAGSNSISEPSPDPLGSAVKDLRRHFMTRQGRR